MTEFDVTRFDAGSSEEWDEVATASPTPHFMFRRGFMGYHADRFNEVSVMVRRGDVVVGIVPATLEGDDVVSHAGLTFGTLVPRVRLGLDRTLAVLSACAEHFASLGSRRWIVKPLPHIYSGTAEQDDICALNLMGAHLVRRDVATAVAPHRPRVLSTERRRSIKRGLASDLRVTRSDDVKLFLDLMGEVLAQRHQTSAVHTADELRLLMERFPDEIALHVALNRSGAISAGIVTFSTPWVVHAQYIAASDEARASGGLDIVADALIGMASESGRWFDFGTSNERDQSVNWGLVRNKEGFGGGSVAYDRYALAL